MNNTERHAQLVDAGWTTRFDGLLRSPDTADARAYTIAAAWSAHTEEATTGTDHCDRSDRTSRVNARGEAAS